MTIKTKKGDHMVSLFRFYSHWLSRERTLFTTRLFHASVKQMKQVKQDFQSTISPSTC